MSVNSTILSGQAESKAKTEFQPSLGATQATLGALTFIKPLFQDPLLTTFTVQSKNLDLQSIRLIGQGLNQAKRVTTCMLYNCDIDDDMVTELCSFLANNQYLERLILTFNNITDKGMIAVVKLLASNPRIRYYALDCNKFRLDSIKLLAETMIKHQHCTHMAIGNSRYDRYSCMNDDAVIAIANMLKQNKFLMSLDLGYVLIDERTELSLEHAIKINGSIQKLKFTHHNNRSFGFGLRAAIERNNDEFFKKFNTLDSNAKDFKNFASTVKDDATVALNSRYQNLMSECQDLERFCVEQAGFNNSTRYFQEKHEIMISFCKSQSNQMTISGKIAILEKVLLEGHRLTNQTREKVAEEAFKLIAGYQFHLINGLIAKSPSENISVQLNRAYVAAFLGRQSFESKTILRHILALWIDPKNEFQLAQKSINELWQILKKEKGEKFIASLEHCLFAECERLNLDPSLVLLDWTDWEARQTVEAHPRIRFTVSHEKIAQAYILNEPATKKELTTLCRGINRKPECRTLTLSCHPDDELMSIISKELRTNLSLVCFNFEHGHYDRKISDRGCLDFLDMMKYKKNIADLNFSCNHLTDISAKALAEELRSNTMLKSLKLAYNKIGRAGFSALLAALKVNQSLSYLDLSSNLSTSWTDSRESILPKECVDTLCEMLLVNKSLQSLILSKGMIDFHVLPEMMEQIIDALEQNKVLTQFEINLGWVGLDYDARIDYQKRIKAILERNKELAKQYENSNKGLDNLQTYDQPLKQLEQQPKLLTFSQDASDLVDLEVDEYVLVLDASSAKKKGCPGVRS